MKLLLPFKGLSEAKSRWTVDGTSRRELVLRILTDNLTTAARVLGAPNVYLVSPEPFQNEEVSHLKVSGKGLNHDLEEARSVLLERDYRGAIGVLLPDLPALTDQDIVALREESRKSQVVLCPDYLDVGTNALALSPGNCLPFLFEGESFQRHAREAGRLSLSTVVLKRAGLANDCDDSESLRKFSIL